MVMDPWAIRQDKDDFIHLGRKIIGIAYNFLAGPTRASASRVLRLAYGRGLKAGSQRARLPQQNFSF